MKNHVLKKYMPVFLLAVLVIAAVIYLLLVTRTIDTALTASGTVEAVEVSIASELSGRVAEVLVAEGDAVKAGDVLLKLDDTALQAQRRRAVAALDTAKAALTTAEAARNTAQASLDSAEAQYQLALSASRQETLSTRQAAWRQTEPSEFDLPVWYYQKADQIGAAIADVEAAGQQMEEQQAHLTEVIAQIAKEDLQEVELRLALAEASFITAKEVLDRANLQSDQILRDAAQTDYDTANNELEDAQQAYIDLDLSTEQKDDLENARATLAVAQERLDTTQDRWLRLLTGEDSLKVQAAQAAVDLAKASQAQVIAAADQAQKVLAQAETELAVLDVQLAKLVINAPSNGVILSRNIEVGEVIQPGASLMTLGDLSHLTITVYVPEDRYGEILQGQSVQVQVDSFPEDIFQAQVVHIADQAEFTPRNVQTDSGRKTTVFAIKLSVQDGQNRLKPGMPANVDFGK